MKLYIIHGWTYTLSHWSETISDLKQHDIDVIPLRVPGLTEPSEAVWTIDKYVDWLSEKLHDDPHPIVLGHSNGGRIALNLLSKHPDRFRHLILLNSAGINLDTASISRKRQIFMLASRLLRPLKHIPVVRRVVYRLIGGSDYDNAPPNMKRTLANMLSSDAMLDITHITTPTTILWGKQDKTTPIELGRKIARLMPQANIKEFEDWKHAPYITHPHELSAAIINTLEGIK